MKVYKNETTITKLRDMKGTDLKGTNLLGLSSCADKLGFTSQVVRGDRKGFLSDYMLPAIANILTKYLIRREIDECYKSFAGAMLILKLNNEFAKGKIRGEKIFHKYLRLLLPQKKLFFYEILASLLMTIVGIVSSVFNNVIYDEILPYKQENT